jgi:hypothetical protein
MKKPEPNPFLEYNGGATVDLPLWGDEEAIYELVREWMGKNPLDPDAEGISPLSVRVDDSIRDAIAAAREGNLRPLTELLGDDHLFKELVRSRLPPDEALQLLLEGKPRKIGRPPMSAQERQRKYSVYEAARIERDIDRILRRWYPDQKKGGIVELACKIATRIVNEELGTDLKDETLLRHVTKRGKNDRHVKMPDF